MRDIREAESSKPKTSPPQSWPLVVLGCELVAAVRAVRLDPARLPANHCVKYRPRRGRVGMDGADRSGTEDVNAAVALVEQGLGE
jgi:hypothetical protein